jgi:hypothetical protein
MAKVGMDSAPVQYALDHYLIRVGGHGPPPRNDFPSLPCLHACHGSAP